MVWNVYGSITQLCNFHVVKMTKINKDSLSRNERHIVEMGERASFFLAICFIGLLIAGISEAILLGIAYFHADKVSCNLLWCTFTAKIKNESISQDCFENNQRINCSEIQGVNWSEIDEI